VVELFSAELQRVALSRFMPGRILAGGRVMARDLERMMREAPADLRRALRRIADGEIGRVRAPGVELLGTRLTRGIERLTGAVASGALLVAGSLLVLSGGWHRPVGDALLALGALGSILVALGALRRGREP
jgi:ubiquinone biosynthesis protein